MKTGTPSSLADSLRLTPTLYKEDAAMGGRTHAAFALVVRIPFVTTKSDEGFTVRFNFATVVEEQLAEIKQLRGGATARDEQYYLASMGIPATYATTFKELKAFLDVEHCTLCNLKVLGTTIVFSGNETSPGSPTSMTLRYGPITFEQKPGGNYRDMVATYHALPLSRVPATDGNPPLIHCLVNAERKSAVILVSAIEMFTNRFGVNLAKGHLEIEFTLIDRRVNAPVVDHPGYGG